jgi:hypothetical protein
MDVLCIVLIFTFFGVGHAYVEACERLKVRPQHD